MSHTGAGRTDVLIVGAGRAGLVTGRLLQNAGISLSIHERDARIGDASGLLCGASNDARSIVQRMLTYLRQQGPCIDTCLDRFPPSVLADHRFKKIGLAVDFQFCQTTNY
jgi:cation diffusion facilitator CzcD-associated flavoprotein CzcO